MKKLVLLVALALFAFTTAQAQEVRLGAKGGLNIASMGGNYGFGSLSSRTAFHIGGLAEIPVKGDFALQAEILYSSEGSGWAWGLGSTDIKLDYVRIPVLAKYNMPFVEGLSAELGPVFGLLVNAKEGSLDIKDDFKGFDAQIGIGATYQFDFGLFASLRYNKGLLNVWDGNDPDGYARKNQSNVFQITAGYSF